MCLLLVHRARGGRPDAKIGRDVSLGKGKGGSGSSVIRAQIKKQVLREAREEKRGLYSFGGGRGRSGDRGIWVDAREPERMEERTE